MFDVKSSLNETKVPAQEFALAELEQRIMTVTSGRIRDLRVEVVGEGILLTGRTNTYYTKQLATQIALESHRSMVLENTIEVM